MLLHFLTVDNLCAIITMVKSPISCTAFITDCSVKLSRALVASSKIRIFGFLRYTLKKEINCLLNDLKSIKIKSKKVKNKNMHYTADKKINTIHNINKYIKKGTIINFTKNEKITSIVNCLLGKKSTVRNIEFSRN